MTHQPMHRPKLLTEADGSTKAAILMLRRGLSAQEAKALLAAAGGNFNVTLAEVRRP
jgi:N-acetylmuramic acid 6-phosphate (MurNAc-6-P) etherase